MNDATAFTPERSAQRAAVFAIAATYFYFLIFAEFAFLELARPVAGDPTRLRLLMTVLGLGGLAGSVLAAWRFRLDLFQRHLGHAFRACGAAAAVALMARGWVTLLFAALLVGGSLGWLTVTLCTGLRSTVGTRRLGLVAGLGTGLAYAACNLPWIFHATPYAQAVIAAVVAGCGAISTSWLQPQEPSVSLRPEYRPGGLVAWIAILLALVWMDSAAFYVIQHTPALRESTWGGSGMLLGNAAVHLVAAVLAGFVLDRGGAGRVVLAAYALLAAACALLAGGVTTSAAPEILYTAGVSLYSVVLLQVPARSGRVWAAALVFAVSGWVGSAMGIGMAGDLHRIPPLFIVAAGVVVIGGLLWRARAGGAAGVAAALVVAVATLGGPELRAADDTAALIARGRAVYVSEGCIHCHSQYVRPGTADEARWGPAVPLTVALRDQPPLFGNRRQGPDLAQVGARRSEAWNRLHLMDPRGVSPGSRMPSYAHLFEPRADGRASDGDALVAYLGSLGGEAAGTRYEAAQAWATAAVGAINANAAAKLFELRCASCHGSDGRGQGPMADRLNVLPPDFQQDPWRHVPPGSDASVAVARIIRFGVPGGAMAGHDELSDAEIAGLVRHVLGLHAESMAGLAQP